MIILDSGLNTFYISNQNFTDSVFNVDFESALLIENKTLDMYNTGFTDRYVKFDIELVENGKQDLSQSKIYLVKGSHQITITQGDKTYTDIVFVEFDALTDKKYNKSKTIYTYKKQQ